MPAAATKDASEPPPVDAAPSDHPSDAAPGPGQLDEMDHVGRALHRRTPHERRELDGDTGDHRGAEQGGDAVLDAGELAGRARPCLERRGGVGGDGVRRRPTRKQADVDRRAHCGVGQGLQADDLVGQLDDRAGALLRLDTSVGGASVHVETPHVPGLALPHDVAVGPARLQAERHVDGPAELDQQRLALLFRVLLVGRAHHHQLGERLEPVLDQRLHRIQRGEDPALHVRHARSGDVIAVDPQRALGGGAVGVHRVEMAQQHRANRAPTGATSDDG